MKPPLYRFLESCYDETAINLSGNVANYIPELKKCDPDKFGISLTTLDGHTYNKGDCVTPFTIQSISKAFVFAQALEDLGSDCLESVISVEPSGDAFNSIRLTQDNRPFNPMVNAGAIACTGLIVSNHGKDAFRYIIDTLSRFAGRELEIDEAVYQSESLTGNRNRAIAWLLRNYSRLPEEVDYVLDVYFRQCAILVTAQDLSVMAATLANNGTNPRTNEKIISPYVVARTLSVMTSSGMYDYAGQWLYKIGMPAKSGVAGGIIASLPASLGLGIYSPRLDSYGNSVRGISVCEKFSSYLNLHVLSRNIDIKACILADYNLAYIRSRRQRLPLENQLLQEYQDDVRIVELVGALTVSTMDFISRTIISKSDSLKFLVLDMKRVPGMSDAAASLLATLCNEIEKNGIKVIFSGMKTEIGDMFPICENLGIEERFFILLEDAIECVENAIIKKYSDGKTGDRAIQLSEQLLLKDFSSDEINSLERNCLKKVYKCGEQIVFSGEPAKSFFFLQIGNVSIKLPNGTRLSSLSAGMSFGEMALLEGKRSADVWADTYVECLELTLDSYNDFKKRHPESGERLMRNGALLLSERLRIANGRIDTLSSYR
jgi:glutaminase